MMIVAASIATLAWLSAPRDASAQSSRASGVSDVGYTAAPSPAAAPNASPWSSSSFVVQAPLEPPPDLAKRKKPEPEPSGFALDAAAAIEMPIMIGGQATLEVPYRFLFQGEVGVLPGFALDAVDGALTSAGAYDQTTSDLVRNGLRNSLVVRLSGGWRPFPDHGFEILGGYTLASLGGGVSARQAVQAVGGVSLPVNIPDGDIVLHTTIHSFHVSLGWRWVIAEHFLIRMNLGYMQALSSSSHVDVPTAFVQNATVASGVAAANQTIDSKLNDIYKTYVKLPVVGLSAGYRF